MKLVEILARELKEWPATTACFAQDDDGDIYNYVSTSIVRVDGEWDGEDDSYLDHSFDCPGLYNQDLASDHDTAIVTREMWENERAKMNEWNGDGFPPVGTYCEYKLNSSGKWFKCKIKYVLTGCRSAVIWCDHLNYDQLISFDSASYDLSIRPIKTPEQIAAEERDAAINDMGAVVDMCDSLADCMRTLYDAGYRKTGDSK